MSEVSIGAGLKMVRPLFDETVAIVENKRINEKYFKLIFRSKNLARNVKPGQFLMMQIGDKHDPFLRRPFSYYRVSSDRIEVLYEILGYGTRLLSQKKKGDEVKVMGALGKSFAVKSPRKKRVLVAGGVGVPPLVFFAEKNKADYLLIGTKSKQEVMPKKELSKVKSKILFSTDDGSYGVKGRVTLLLEDIIEKEGAENIFIQTCGPMPMMNAVMMLAKKYEIPGEASLDKTMGCGMGICLGCMVKTQDGWVPSCTEGPIFSFDKLVEVGS